MTNKLTWLIVLCALLLVADFLVLMTYGYALRSTNLFIARSTVFYPLAWINLILGLAVLLALAVSRVRQKRR